MSKIDVQIQKEYGEGGKSKVRSYQDLVVGSHSSFFLILFESVTWLALLGGVVRFLTYPLILGRVGAGTRFTAPVLFRHPKKIIFGHRVTIGKKCLVDAKGFSNRGIIIQNDCVIADEAVISCKEGDITLGNGVTIGTRCNISSNSSITIGAGTTLGEAATLFATSHNFDETDTAILDQGWTSQGIVVGENCRLGNRVVVTDGVTIGNNVTVDDDAVVTKNLPDGAHVGGAPARPV